MVRVSLESSKIGSTAIKPQKFKIMYPSGIIFAMMVLAAVTATARNLAWNQPIHECRMRQSKQAMRPSRKVHPAWAGKTTNHIGKNDKEPQNDRTRMSNSEMAAARQEL